MYPRVSRPLDRSSTSDSLPESSLYCNYSSSPERFSASLRSSLHSIMSVPLAANATLAGIAGGDGADHGNPSTHEHFHTNGDDAFRPARSEQAGMGAEGPGEAADAAGAGLGRQGEWRRLSIEDLFKEWIEINGASLDDASKDSGGKEPPSTPLDSERKA